MIEIMYSPEDVGKEVMNSHGRLTKIRKYHTTEQEQEIARKKWGKVAATLRKQEKMAGEHFYNPYRKGIYYYQIYALFSLGANRWHSLGSILKRIEKIMSEISIKQNGLRITAWERYRSKTSRNDAVRCKDHVGKIQENMVIFQRLTKLHPCGYKLRQVLSAVDIKRETKKGFPNGLFSYRLSTYDNIEKALPIRDYSLFKFPLHERKYVSHRFIGTVITRDKTITGTNNEMSSMQSR